MKCFSVLTTLNGEDHETFISADNLGEARKIVSEWDSHVMNVHEVPGTVSENMMKLCLAKGEFIHALRFAKQMDDLSQFKKDVIESMAQMVGNQGKMDGALANILQAAVEHVLHG